MKKCVAVFKSRTQVLSFIDVLNNYGIFAKTISTPKEAHIGCGISAEFALRQLNIAKRIIQTQKYSSFYGFFLIEKNSNRTSVVRI